jgi:hypothetical protein
MGAADHGKQDRSAKRNRKAKQHFRQPKKSVLEQREGEELEVGQKEPEAASFCVFTLFGCNRM